MSLSERTRGQGPEVKGKYKIQMTVTPTDTWGTGCRCLSHLSILIEITVIGNITRCCLHLCNCCVQMVIGYKTYMKLILKMKFQLQRLTVTLTRQHLTAQLSFQSAMTVDVFLAEETCIPAQSAASMFHRLAWRDTCVLILETYDCLAVRSAGRNLHPHTIWGSTCRFTVGKCIFACFPCLFILLPVYLQQLTIQLCVLLPNLRYPPLGLIWTVMLVWRKGNINRTVSVLSIV